MKKILKLSQSRTHRSNKQKNETINKLNGKVYYYKKTAEYYKKKI